MTGGFQVPPGIGEEDAPFDSVEWAKSVRTGLLGHSYALPKVAGHVADYLSMLRETGGWAQLNKPDGSTFATLEEFCAHRRRKRPERVILDELTRCNTCGHECGKGARVWRHDGRPGVTCGLCENGVA